MRREGRMKRQERGEWKGWAIWGSAPDDGWITECTTTEYSTLPIRRIEVKRADM